MSTKQDSPHKERKNENPESLNLIALLLVIILFLAILFSCGKPAYPNIARNATPSEFCSQFLDILPEKGPQSGMPATMNDVYFDDEVIITGAMEQINLVKREADIGSSEAAAEPLVTIPLDIFSNNYGVVVTQFKITRGSVEDYVKNFNSLAGTFGFQLPPFAEPNYIIREPRDLNFEGDPGSSSVEVDAASEPYANSATYSDFIDQWAFTDGPSYLDLEPGTGENITIMVFDTSPLESGEHRISLSDASASKTDQLRAVYDLCVSAPLTDGDSDSVFNSHGLFIANLAHAVSPASKVVLVEVMQATGEGDNAVVRGDILTLLNLMKLHLDRATYLEQKVVVNLSLGFGFHPDNPGDFLGNQIELTKSRLLEFSNCKCAPTYNPMPTEHTELARMPVYSMQLILYSLWNDARSNIVFVAAAGNDGKTEKAQSPADYPNVIGVSGNKRQTGNETTELSCFSNLGDVIGPAGEGTVEGRLCTIDLRSDCADSANCDKALTSLIITENGRPAYAFWAGTSFSTPLVSGLAAKIFGSAPDQSSSQTRCSLDPSPAPNNVPGERSPGSGTGDATSCPP